MEEEKGMNYESMNKQKEEIEFIPGEGGQTIVEYPSMVAQGFEGVKLPHGHDYSGPDGGDDITIRELPQEMISNILEYAKMGDLDSLLSKYQKWVDGAEAADIFDAETLENLKRLFAEGRATKFGEEAQKAWLKKAIAFISAFRMEIHPDYGL